MAVCVSAAPDVTGPVCAPLPTGHPPALRPRPCPPRGPPTGARAQPSAHRLVPGSYTATMPHPAPPWQAGSDGHPPHQHTVSPAVSRVRGPARRICACATLLLCPGRPVHASLLWCHCWPTPLQGPGLAPSTAAPRAWRSSRLQEPHRESRLLPWALAALLTPCLTVTRTAF